MRSKEFLKEAPARYDDSGQEIGPAAGTVGAAQADAARIAQGQKNLNAIKGFFGAKPEELKDAPPGTSIDPVQRARMGYKPATQQEIAAFQAANPNYGKVVGRDGQPIKSGTPGVTWDAGGEKAVVQTAQAAAPQSKGDAHAGQQGYNTDLERIPGAAHAGQGGTTPAPAAVAPAAVAPADDSAARAAAAADAGRKPVTDTGVGNTQLNTPDEWARLAGVNPEKVNPHAGAAFPSAEVPAAAGGGVRAQDVGPANTAPAQAATPAAKKAAPRVSPAVVGYASSMGLYKNGQPNPAAIKAFQEKNGLKADGVIGPNTSAAILSTAKPGMAGSGQGQRGVTTGNTVSKPVGSPMPPQPGQGGTSTVAGPVSTGRQPWEHTPPVTAPAQAATPVAQPNRGTNTKYKNPPETPPIKMSYDKNGKPLFPMPSPFPANESQDIQRMRFLAGLSKD